MGYILPVDFHQYQQYQRRHITKSQKSNLALEKIFRAELKELKRGQEEDLHEQSNENSVSAYKPTKVYQPTESKYTKFNHNQLADITGKGRYFSETI
ncbi:hypothetical protein [Aquisalibacillus elongatus]|uniref:hypothetical protein n=1 Tax=Aquisalibacillus elongatus TaxID=485577 RepID=UPI0011CDE177|nr:hypothetical protein [Aquisalibacillus elongatus]